METSEESLKKDASNVTISFQPSTIEEQKAGNSSSTFVKDKGNASS